MAARPLDETSVVEYLRRCGVVEPAVDLEVTGAGDGNINWVRRVRAADGRSWIVKQARDTLEKFPEYSADPRRLYFEARYLEVGRPFDRDGVLPRVFHFGENDHVLVLQDLGDVDRMGESLLRGDDLDDHLCTLALFLFRLHRATAGKTELVEEFANEQMRRLHGDHIFSLPFRENDFDLEPELKERATRIWADRELVDRAGRYYERYLTPNGSLVHADVQSSNVLLTGSGPVLLDAEIAHVGDPAFDVATLIAHVFLPAVARGELDRAGSTATRIWRTYAKWDGVKVADVESYAVIEMIRRTIGAARVPAMQDTAAALRCLDLAEAVLRGEERLVGD